MNQIDKKVNLIKINCQAIDFVIMHTCKIPLNDLQHHQLLLDVDINILIKDTVSCIVLATIQKESDLVEAVRVAII